MGKIWGITKMPQSQSPRRAFPCLQACTQHTRSVFNFSIPSEGPLVSILGAVTCPEFIKSHALSVNFLLQEWFRTFYPSRRRRKIKRKFCTNYLDTYTNAKAMLPNAGIGAGYPYPTFIYFTPCDIKSYHGLYILKAMYSSYCMSMKLNTQNKDITTGNDAVASVFGTCSQTQFRHLNDFLV